MPTVRIDARHVVTDIRQGMSEAALKEKYQLSDRALQSLFDKLVGLGLIGKQEITDRVEPVEKTLTLETYVCPACKMPQFFEFDVCPQCGIIVAKYKTDASPRKKEKEPKREIESKKPDVAADKFILKASPDRKTLTISGLNADLQQEIIEAVKVVLLKSRT